MDSIKDYLSKLEIKNDFLYNKLSDVFVTKVVYYKENKTFYIYLWKLFLMTFYHHLEKPY